MLLRLKCKKTNKAKSLKLPRISEARDLLASVMFFKNPRLGWSKSELLIKMCT